MRKFTPPIGDGPDALTDAAEAVRAGAVTPTRLVAAALARIRAHADLNAIAHLDAERALAEAREREREAKDGTWRGALHGVPITVKDLFNVRGMPTRAGTRAKLPPIVPDEAAAVARLRAAGAIVLAKTNMHEIALGLTGENAWTGDVKNPHDPARQAGGSSSGSAAAVAVGIGYASLVTDTSGSIRIPASYCGVVGFKPSHGLVPLAGALDLVPSCDHAGVLARSVADAAAMMAVLAGNDACRPARIASPIRLGVPRAYLAGALAPPVRDAFEALVAALRGAGAQFVDVALDIGDAAAAYAPLRAESVLVHRHALEADPDSFGADVRAALRRGYSFSALEYLEMRRRQFEMRAAIERTTAGLDALILPAAPSTAPLRGTTEITLEAGPKDLRQAILTLCVPASFAGVPTVVLPCAWPAGLPIGLQILTPFATDGRALAVGAWVEQRLPRI